MPFRMQSIARECAMAIAAVALYALLLLTPLHQAAGLQRDLDAIGYSSLDLWSVCVPNTRDDGQRPVEAAKCPAVGIGKQDLALAAPPVVHLPPVRVAEAVVHLPQVPAKWLHSVNHPAQARAPPETV